MGIIHMCLLIIHFINFTYIIIANITKISSAYIFYSIESYR